MKRPLAVIFPGYATGILLGHFCQPSLLILWGAVLGSAALALGFNKYRRWWLGALLVLLGWANAVSHMAVISPADLRNQLDNGFAAVTVRGVLSEPSQIKITERNGLPTPHSLTKVEVTALRRSDNWERASGKIMVMTPGTLDDRFFSGQKVEVTGVIGPPAPPLAEGLLDYRDYLRTRGIYFQLKAGSTNDWQLAAQALEHPPLTDRFLNWSRHTMAMGLPDEDEPLRLIWAMTLGWHTAFTGDISDPFLRAGTMHLFAIDGLRIALVSGMLLALLRVLQISRAVCGLVCIPAIWFYTAATGWESSAIRASVMMTIVIFGWTIRRPSDLINSLAAAAFIILAWDPQQLFEAGFLLSFMVMLTIALMLPPLNELIDRLLQFDPLVPDSLVPRWKKGGVAGLRVVLRFFALSLAAWAGSIPLSAKYFHLFSPVSPLANVVAVPLGIFALMSNLGSLTCGDWFPWATVLFNHSAWFFMVAMTWISEWATKIPGAYCYVAEPSWLVICFYYVLLVAILTGWLFDRKWRAGKMTVLVGLLMIWIGHWIVARQEVKLTILPLNGSQVVFVEDAGPKNRWLINCGNEASVDFTLKPYLRAQGVNRLSQLILTAGEAGSCGGAAKVDELFGVDSLFTSAVRFRSTTYRNFIDGFDETHRMHKSLLLNETAGPWQVLHPDPPAEFPRADDNALVLCGQFYHSTILLLADLGRNGQSVLLNRTNNLQADIVVAALPGQGEPLCDDLIKAVRPKVIVIVDAEFPVQCRASPKLKARLASGGIPVIYTRTAGAVTIVERPGGWELRTMDGRMIEHGNAQDYSK